MESDKAISLITEQADLRPVTMTNGMGLLPVEQQKAILTEYDNRRNFFLQWLFEHLKEGVHYGFPPGCTPGNTDPRQWRAKPSLYKSGAILITDLLKIRSDYFSDTETWKMLGEPKGTICRKCTLEIAGEYMGCGSGAYQVGQRKMDANASIKMADKRAHVAAVIHSVPMVGDLFTQDIEDDDRPADLNTRLIQLLKRFEDGMAANASQWDGKPKDLIRKVADQLIGNAPLNTLGALNAFEKKLEKVELDWNTGDVLPNEELT